MSQIFFLESKLPVYNAFLMEKSFDKNPFLKVSPRAYYPDYTVLLNGTLKLWSNNQYCQTQCHSFAILYNWGYALENSWPLDMGKEMDFTGR